ncbi:MAG: DUF6147 family protein [Lachnospiraceae bacterium]|nr:DUF6147 family protein [Lachnospiraceae bacterium]
MQAAGPRDGEIVDGSLLTSDLSATDSFQEVSRGAILAMGSSEIINRYSGVIYLAGETFGYQVCDKLKVFVYLERLEGNEWVPAAQRFYDSENAISLSEGVYLTVPKNYYYRVKGSHAAIKGNVTETNTTRTKGIYIE